MRHLVINSKGPLKGKVKVNGSKNAALPILAATLLTEDKCRIDELPNLLDVNNMFEIIRHLGGEISPLHNKGCEVWAKGVDKISAPYETASRLRASFLITGPLLARFGKAKIALPGGCAIGSRPVDLHLKGFAAMGAEITMGHGYVEAAAGRLKGTKIYLDFPSVGATENILMAACLAEGQTIIENAAIEPEIVDLANFLNLMGAEITGAGTDTIKVGGVKELHGAEHTIIPDRIEAGTFMTAAAITRGQVTISNVVPEHLKPLSAKLREIGVTVEEDASTITVSAKSSSFKPSDIKTLPYPGFPTDMQAQLCSLMSIVPGTSIITETIFENRFMHVGELQRLGANIKLDGRTAVIEGGAPLSGAQVTASDLRAGAALVLAGLAAEGTTRLCGLEHIERGYDNLAGRLCDLGADITVVGN